ncbi:hypothetical protein [Marinobacter confluentis]|uniref:Uncharacterized protein n=1 Tax=Marinobacter confluentis TaxID=1697557 RepID=A0A4Z1C9D5_9GAMM|nr:hypothetical protein [Marinobacter confluentis]TGN40263.1 hypothetical protein E5Q11_08245 [Marinobacter confluentis]
MKNLIRRFSVKQILLSDVFLSAPLALALILASGPVAQWAGGPGATFYLVVGVVMLLWCVDMAAVAFNEGWQQKYLNVMIAVDVVWSLLAVALMMWFAGSLQPVGWALFALNVLVPLDMAWMKWVAGSQPRQPAFG